MSGDEYNTDETDASEELLEKRDKLVERRDKIERKLEEVKQDIVGGKGTMGTHDDSISSAMIRRSNLGRELRAVQEDLNQIESQIDPDLLDKTLDVENFVETSAKLDSVLDELSDFHEIYGAEIEEIQQNRKQAEDLLDSLQELEKTARGLLETSTSAALGSQFEDRKSEIESNIKYWKWASIGSIIFLIIVSGIIYYEIMVRGGTLSSNISKTLLILPISVAVWFTISNYNKGRYLMEEYEFKARMALSLSGFREVLREEVPYEQRELLAEALINTIDKMYENPHRTQNSYSSETAKAPVSGSQMTMIELLKRS